jgi:hypothetical protein
MTWQKTMRRQVQACVPPESLSRPEVRQGKEGGETGTRPLLRLSVWVWVGWVGGCLSA